MYRKTDKQSVPLFFYRDNSESVTSHVTQADA